MTLNEYDIAKEVSIRVSSENNRCGYYGISSEVSEVFKVIADNLEEGNKIRISGFGTFEIKERAPRTGRNVHTGEVVPIPAKSVPNFRPSKNLKERIEGICAKKSSKK